MNEEGEEKEDYQHQIRHDFRNKIQIIEGYLELLKDMDLPDDAKDLADKAIKASEDSRHLLEEWKQKQKEKEK